MDRETVFSPCRKYRYTLWREWGVGSLPLFCAKMRPELFVQFIGLNPSTADETRDDPTIRRCINYAKAWGYGAMCMTNLFAWRATDPKEMKKVSDPVGEQNDFWLTKVANHAHHTVAVWGKDGNHLGRANHVKKLFRLTAGMLWCLSVNQDGTPGHPLYLRKDLIPVPFNSTPIASYA